MKLQDRLEQYLEYCIYRKELDSKTVKAYRIDLNQFFSFVCCDAPDVDYQNKCQKYELNEECV